MMGDDGHELTEEEMLQQAIELSMQGSDADTTTDMSIDESSSAAAGAEGAPPSKRRNGRFAQVDAALELLGAAVTAACGGGADAEALKATAKDVGVLKKLLNNPRQKPEEPKFRKVKRSNKTIARVLGVGGALEVLRSVGFAEDAAAPELLTLADAAYDLGALEHAVSAVGRLAEGARELAFVRQHVHAFDERNGTPPFVWSAATAAEGAPKALVEAALNRLHTHSQPSAQEAAGGGVDPATMDEDGSAALALGVVHTVLHDAGLERCLGAPRV
jgi:hypothetical protein